MRNKPLRILSAVMAVVILTFSCMTSVCATSGSITVTMKYDNTILTDGVLTIYKVADINYNYTSEFAGCGFDLSDLGSSTLGWLLWSWALQTGAAGTSIAVGADGTVTFSNLDTGIYLIVPSTNPTGYSVEPSVVPVPLNGEYDVETEPKIEPTTTPDTPDPTPTTTVTEPDEEVTVPEDEEPSDTDEEVDIDDEEEPEVEDKETLPQTGQLNYPVPIMAGTGGVCVAVGLILTKTDKKRDE